MGLLFGTLPFLGIRGETMQLTEAQIKYLLALYELQQQGAVRLTHIAEKLHVSKPSVHRMLGQLEEYQLVDLRQKGGLKLTDAGIAVASEYFRQFRILLDFFTQELGMEPQVAEENATLLLGCGNGAVQEMCRCIQNYNAVRLKKDSV